MSSADPQRNDLEQDGSSASAPANCSAAECEHDWQDEYYGTRCAKCKTFYPFGCEPWMPTDDALGEVQHINTFDDDEPPNSDYQTPV